MINEISNEQSQDQPNRTSSSTTIDNSQLSRRKFIKIGAATLTISVVGGGLLKLLSPRKEKLGAIKASIEKPNKNPAFVFNRTNNGSYVCTTNLPDGNIIQHELNNVGAEIYLACDGKLNRKEIIRQAAAKLGKDVQEFESEAHKFLLELEQQNLIVTTGKVNLFYRTVVRYETT